MANALIHSIKPIAHSFRAQAYPPTLPCRPPPERAFIAPDRTQSECSTSYGTRWPCAKRGSRLCVAAKRGRKSASTEGGDEDLAGVEDTARNLLARRTPAPATPATPAYGDFEDAELKELGAARTEIFTEMFEEAPTTWRDVPLHMLPRNEHERRKLTSLNHMMAYYKRMWDSEAMDEMAFAASEGMRERSHNIYATTQKVAGIMRQIEKEDFALGEHQTYFSSWSRAELMFASQFDEFNAKVKENIDNIGRQPLDEELREKLEAIGEATLLPPTEAEMQEPKFLTNAEVARFMEQNFLEGVLPGVSLNNPMERFAEDIYDGEAKESPDEIFDMVEAEAEVADGEGAE